MVPTVDGFPADLGKQRAGREPLDQVGIGNVGSSERDQVRKPLCDRRADSVTSVTFPSSFFMVAILTGRPMIACHKVLIQSLSLFTSITTKSGSLAACATAAIP
jgi:hypothetical protein